MFAIENNTEYKIVSAVLSTSDRLLNIEVDLKNVIVSFQIYENIEIPYLSADFLIIDRNNIIMDFDFQTLFIVYVIIINSVFIVSSNKITS